MSHETEASPVDAVLGAAPALLRALAIELKGIATELHPDAYVTAWPRQKIISFGYGPKKMSEHYFYIAIQPKHVNAGFYFGASLPDPSSLLEGSGKNLRHIKLHSLKEVRSPSLIAMLAAAKRERASRQPEA